MSYQVLARKWRPKRFSEMVGQQHVLKALENALNQDRLHHAYLFTGTRGVGKTTIARIFAKCLNCQSGVSAEPCGTCSICTSIDQGRFLDLMEIDAASHTGVDSIRELLDNTQYTPTQGKYKVYLIDEVHMLSSSSFNALLKTLEEPPEHVKFLLATTDPQKLPVTVLSRCLQFNLKAMSASQISEHLKVLLEKERITFEEEALELIAKSAHGSMRDALSLSDQAIAHGNESLKAAEVRSMLGLVDRAYISALLDALQSADAKNLLSVVEQIASDAPNYQSVLAELISYLHRLIVQQVSGADKDAKVKAFAQAFTAEDLQLFYQIAIKGRQDLAISPDPKQGMEVCLLRMLLFKPEKLLSGSPHSVSSSSGGYATNQQHQEQRQHQQEQVQNYNQKPNQNPSPSQQNPAKAHFDQIRSEIQKKNTNVSEKPEAIAVSQPIPQGSYLNSEGLEERADESLEPANPKAVDTLKAIDTLKVVDTLKAVEPIAEASNATNAEIISSSTQSYDAIADKWTQIVLVLKLSGPALMVAKNSNLHKLSDKQYSLLIDKKYEMLASQQTLAIINTAMNDFYGVAINLSMSLGKPDQLTPEQHFLNVDKVRSGLALKSILQDDVVKTFQHEFGAEIQEGSTKLLH